VNKDGSLTDMPLKDFEGSLFILGPVPLVILLKQGVKRFRYIGKPRNPASIKIDKTNELVDTLHSRRPLPLYDICDLFIVHFEPFATNIDSEELYLLLMELTFLCIAKEFRVLKTLQHVVDTFDMFSFGPVMIECVVQVVLQVFVQEWHEHFIHVMLEAGQHVRKAECHNSHPIGSEWSHESRFPLVARANANLIITGF
jgi:hypothetical protein